MVNSIESSANAVQGALFKAFNVSITMPFDLSKIPGWYVGVKVVAPEINEPSPFVDHDKLLKLVAFAEFTT